MRLFRELPSTSRHHPSCAANCRVREGLHLSGCYPIVTRTGNLYFLADTSVNIEPTAEDLAEIALCTADTARRFDVVPRVAMLSFSNFGSTKHPLCGEGSPGREFLGSRPVAGGRRDMADAAVSAEMLEQLSLLR